MGTNVFFQQFQSKNIPLKIQLFLRKMILNTIQYKQNTICLKGEYFYMPHHLICLFYQNQKHNDMYIFFSCIFAY